MPRNQRGGKAYKKGKKADQDDSEDEGNIVMIDVQPDQMVGRILRLLGDLNTQVYCQDGVLRVCKICRSIKKKVKFKVGDVVLISLRDCEVPKADLEKGKRGSRGDVLARFHSAQFDKLKQAGIPDALFTKLEGSDEMAGAGAGDQVRPENIRREEELFGADSDSDSEEMDDDAIDNI
jgi:initiation factor 1A